MKNPNQNVKEIYGGIVFNILPLLIVIFIFQAELELWVFVILSTIFQCFAIIRLKLFPEYASKIEEIQEIEEFVKL